MAYLPAGISVEELLNAAEDLQQLLPTTSRACELWLHPGRCFLTNRAGLMAL